MWDYTDKVKDHYLHPRNVGEVENADGVGEVGSLKCGDALRLSFKLDENKKIVDIKFKTFGCGSAIASSSVLTEMCKGKTIEEAEKITNQMIADELGGLPAEKMHCSVMGQEALEAAIRFYRSGGKDTEPAVKHGHVVCTCFNITDLEIEEAIIQNQLKTVEEVTNYTKAGGGCGGCIGDIEEILARINGVGKVAEPSAPRMTNVEKIEKIKKVLDEDVRPLLHHDGGDCSLVDVDGNTVFIKFGGHCAGCAHSSVTQFSVVERILREKVLQEIVVVKA